ncbi:PREDICTED: dual 3',5'-cyclic-AMP and -GMP phosphodiesterase 11A-like [Rhagoletis zephyria]|uniref:dual 3',5'-cyclic-AMP and -GMP phosphodiesterase 11A-like n=1 Tax=Rhagoletis zephyria TaxID=28612 RepID=UPI0008119B4D|nr:PREDICTED: dual 3',5'-cyclic-AMP and -GMP phosphodiesterase 11A-like [Rhagoletis zephyria]
MTEASNGGKAAAPPTSEQQQRVHRSSHSSSRKGPTTIGPNTAGSGAATATLLTASNGEHACEDIFLEENYEKIEDWLDEHPAFVQSYFLRKVSRPLVDQWLVTHSTSTGTLATLSANQTLTSTENSGANTPVRKISAHEFEASGGGFLRPMVSTTFDGTPTFLPIQQDNAATKLTTTTESQSTAAAVGFEQLTTTATAAAAVGVPSSTASSVTTPGATATPQSATTAVKAASGLAKHQQQHHQHHQSSSLARISPTSGEFGILPSLSSTSLISSNTSSSSMNTLTGSTQLGTVSASSSTSTATATPSKNPSFITAGARIRHASLGGPLISFGSNVSGKSREEIEAINNENELIFELVKDICNDLDVRSLCHKILKNVSILTNADRCSLFIVRGEKNEPKTRYLASHLFDVSGQSTIEQVSLKEEITIPWGKGIVGHVAESGKSVNIPDCYKDAHFSSTIDQKTGYTTRNMLCNPIVDVDGTVLGVAQVINKNGAPCFTASDEAVFARYLQFCGIGLRNAQLYELSQLENRRNQVLLDLARMIFEKQSTIENIIFRILVHTLSLLQCERAQILLLTEGSSFSFTRVFDLARSDVDKPDFEKLHQTPFEGRFPINVGVTGYVASTGETLNIADAYADPRFDAHVDDHASNEAGFRHRGILCMPIRNASRKIIGVAQLVNKLNGQPFNMNDINIFEGFAIFSGMGIENTQMFEKAVKAMAKQRVTLELLSYHASATDQEAYDLQRMMIPSTSSLCLDKLHFRDFSLTEDQMIRGVIRMFLDLDLIERFHIDYKVLCKWILSVRKNYRPVLYHNWRHAFNVAQFLYAILVNTNLSRILGELETLALIVACLSHDLDHRGTNNSFQIKTSSPLAQLYSTSTLEHHHFDQSLMILNSQGNQILSNLSPEEYRHVVSVLEEAILATDLAVYFRKRDAFFELVNREALDWGNDVHRSLLRSMLMTACDIAAITKPWEVQKVVAELVASEFFQQGDIEKAQLKIEPIDMMNREKREELPKMQLSFISSICLPVYESFAKLFPNQLTPLVNGVLDNRQKWTTLSSMPYQLSIKSPVSSVSPYGGGGGGSGPPQIDGSCDVDERQQGHDLKYLSSLNRFNVNSKVRARQYISDTFRSFGLNVTEQKFKAPYIENEGINIIGIRKGTARRKRSGRERLRSPPVNDQIVALVIGAHYDTVKNTSGLNDNGSGIGVMLEMGAIGSKYFVNEYLIPNELSNVQYRSHFKGAIIMDTLLNFDAQPGTQDIPNDIHLTVPGFSTAIKQSNYSGNFLAMFARTNIDQPISRLIEEKWSKHDSESAAQKSTTSEVVDWKQYQLKPVSIKSLSKGKAASFQDLQKHVNMLRSDHLHFWYHNHSSYPNSLGAVLLTDTGKESDSIT